MIISVKASSSIDAGKYLTDRNKEAFFVIEGDAKRFDKTAKKLLNDNSRKKISHYSFVLSFKEENLSKEQLIEYFNQFKQEMFKNYNPEELELLSVIHFDDNKPHIHCTVINSSQIDNNRDLRIFRGNVDISRTTSLQEVINYKNGLLSPFDNYNILSLTPEQKERDWQSKKRGAKYRKVFDDDVFRDVEDFLKSSKNFNDFKNAIEQKYGKIIFKKYSTLISEGVNLSTILKEDRLILTKHKKANGDNYVYNSKIFNRAWFNKNIKQIQKALNNGSPIEKIKFSDKKKSLTQYNRILKETTKKHEEHLYHRKVGKKWVNENLNFVLENDLKRLKNISLDKNILENYTLDELDMKFERFLSYASELYIKKFVDEFKRSNFTINSDFVKLKLNNNIILNLYNEKLRNYLNGDDTQKNSVQKNSQYEDLLWLLKDIKNNKSKIKIRLLLEELIYKQQIKDREALTKLFSELGLKIVKVGEDTKKGVYLTLENKFGKIALYNKQIVELYNLPKFDEADYFKKRNNKIKEKLDGEFFYNFVIQIYLKNIDKYKKIYPNIDNIHQYRLFNSDTFIDTFYKVDIIDKPLIYPKDDFDIVTLIGNNTLRVNKTLDEYRTGMKMADSFARGGYINLYLENVSNEMRQGTIDRIKEMNYDLSLFDQDKHLIYTNTDVSQNKTDNNEKSVKKVVDEFKNDVVHELEINEKFDKMFEKLKENKKKEFKLRNI